MIAPFQLGLDVAVPYGEPAEAGGVVAGVLVAPAAEAPLGRVSGRRGGCGTRARGRPVLQRRGTFSGSGRGYELTLIEAEALEALAADGVEISWEQARRNVVTRGIGLNALVGRRFLIGEVECVGRRLAEPCSHLQRLAPPGILAGLVHRGGLRADILGSGTIRVGDPVGADPGRLARRAAPLTGWPLRTLPPATAPLEAVGRPAVELDALEVPPARRRRHVARQVARGDRRTACRAAPGSSPPARAARSRRRRPRVGSSSDSPSTHRRLEHDAVDGGVRDRRLDRDRVVVDGPDRIEAEARSCDRQHARAAPDVEQRPALGA